LCSQFATYFAYLGEPRAGSSGILKSQTKPITLPGPEQLGFTGASPQQTMSHKVKEKPILIK
jgi:hypothetical protein